MKVLFFSFWVLPLIHSLPQPESLKLIHVLFRHGNRTPDALSLYPNDPYLNETYFPFGLGQLTNAGKRREYSIGQALREKYDSFLGKYYYPEIIDPVSSDFNRTKMSLQLVLASLFQPQNDEIWYDENDIKNTNDKIYQKNVINWQPIPYNYYPLENDKILMVIGSKEYQDLYKAFTNSKQQQDECKKYRDLFEYLSFFSGLNVTTFFQAYALYFGLITEKEWGFKLPLWTVPVLDKLEEIAPKEYFVQSGTTELKQKIVGALLKKIITDSQQKLAKLDSEDELTSKKVYMYSAHETNVANMLIALGVFDKPHVPNYGAYIVIELHQINKKAAVRVFYENYTNEGLHLLKLPNCSEFCDFDTFVNNVKEYIPEK